MYQFKALSLLLIALLITACDTEKNSENNTIIQQNITINGSVMYRERIQPPPDAKLTIRLNNISQADASATIVTEQAFDLAEHSVPVNYQFSVAKESLKPQEIYTVRAEIRGVDGGLLWTTDTTHLIDSAKPIQTLDEIIMISVKPVSSGDNILALINTNWRVSDINGAGVIDRSQTSVMFSADGKLTGLAGCNQYTGDYKMHNGALTIGPIAATKKACVAALNDQENKFFTLMNSVDRFSFNAEGSLVLKTADGKVMVAQRP